MLRPARFLAVGASIMLSGVLLAHQGNTQEAQPAQPPSGQIQPEQNQAGQQSLTDKDAIVGCMLEKSTPENKAVMRALIIAALQDNQPEMKTKLAMLGGVLVDLALSKCSMSMTLMNEKDFGEIGSRYGGELGQELIAAALAKLN